MEYVAHVSTLTSREAADYVAKYARCIVDALKNVPERLEMPGFRSAKPASLALPLVDYFWAGSKSEAEVMFNRRPLTAVPGVNLYVASDWIVMYDCDFIWIRMTDPDDFGRRCDRAAWNDEAYSPWAKIYVFSWLCTGRGCVPRLCPELPQHSCACVLA